MINFDCGNRTKDCENATICPCLNFINEQKKSYKELINSDIFKIATEEGGVM